MKKLVTVYQALNRATWMVSVPSWILMIATPGLSIYFAGQDFIPKWGIAMGFSVGFLLAWLYWSYSITKWRIWAFDHVRNVHHLKKKAINRGLIWKDKSWFEKTEIRSKLDKLKLKQIQKKFEKKDVFNDDPSIPKVTKIYYSIALAILELFFMVVCFGLGVYFILNEEGQISIILSFAVGIFCGYKGFQSLYNRTPQIIMDDRGIETVDTSFMPWNRIKNVEVEIEQKTRNARFYLTYKHRDGLERLDMTRYNVSPKRMEDLLRIYRLRSKKRMH